MPRFLPRLSILPFIAMLGLAVSACSEDETGQVPPPQGVGASDSAYFTGMLITEHEGPKGQIHLADQEEPLWFSNVRDTKAFTLMPEEQGRKIRVIYVHDIGQAESWAHPGADAWIEAHEAYYVIGSGRRGGMGAPELVPFGTEEGAAAFAAQEGGEVTTWEDIPEASVLGDPHRPGAQEQPDKQGESGS